MMNRREWLRSLAAGGAGLALPACLRGQGQATGQSPPSPASAAPAAGRRPNIIFILVDDLGWGELGCYGNRFNQTPHLDALAGQGMRFTYAYAAAPVCSPYRVSLMTGQHPARVGITDYLRPADARHLPEQALTLPKLLKRAGYATGIIGKWHLSGYLNEGARVEVPPARQGFDEAILCENRGIGGGSYFHPYHFNREIQPRLGPREYLTDRLNLEAVDFIRRHKDHPFFLYLSHYAVHTALKAKPQMVARYRAKPEAGKTKPNNPVLAAMLESVDEGVGLIVRTLEELKLADDTIVVFTGDNGGEFNVTVNGHLRHGKSTLYEGGLREPLIVRWPGVVRPGTVSQTPVCSTDFLPTFCQAAGTAPPAQATLDGLSMMPVLKDPAAPLDRKALYWHYPLDKPHFLGGRSAGAVRCGQWKLIEFFDDGSAQLFNLADDPSETTDLSAAQPAKAAELRAMLAQWRKDAGASAPPQAAPPKG